MNESTKSQAYWGTVEKLAIQGNGIDIGCGPDPVTPSARRFDLEHCALDIGLGTGKSTRLRLTHLIPAGRLTLDYFVRQTEGDASSLLMFRALRNLPIQKLKPSTPLGSLRWFVHRLIHRVPREQYEIQKAHQRGSLKGWELAQA